MVGCIQRSARLFKVANGGVFVTICYTRLSYSRLRYVTTNLPLIVHGHSVVVTIQPIRRWTISKRFIKDE